jgi:hypothetical protein
MPTSVHRWLAATAALFLVAGGLAAGAAFAAGNPTVGVGGTAPASASYSGSVGPGNPDPLGPPAVTCQQNLGCQRQVVELQAPSGFTTTSSITLTVSLKYGSGGSDDLDIGIFDKDGNLLASEFAVTDGQPVAAANVEPGAYTVEVDGDVTTGIQNYTATVTASAGPKYVPPARSTGGLSFATTTLTDPFRLGTEPTVMVDQNNGNIYESPIFGFSTTQSFLSRSTDGGRTFNILGLPGVGKLDQCTGGGDSDLATDQHAGDLYMIDLGGAPEVPARVSHDGGLSWSSSCEANFHDGANYFTDRQWLSTDRKHGVEWYIYRDGLLNTDEEPEVEGTEIGKQGYGEYLKFAPLATAPGTAGAAQLAFSSLCKNSAGLAAPCINDVLIAGNAVSDNSPASPGYGTTYLAIERAQGVSVASFDPTSPGSLKEHTVAAKSHQVLFPTVAVDRAGTVYLAWTDATDFRVYLSHDLNHNLDSWSAPVVVNGGPVYTTVMPWVVAGDAGRVDVVFYGTSNPKSPTLNYGPWYPYLAQSLNADAAAPTFTQAAMTDRPTHIDPVCLSGLGCTADTGPGGDRELGDFFRVGLDPSGRAVVSFADGDNQLGTEVANGPLAAPSFADFVRQSTGPSLYASVGGLPAVPAPVDCVTAGPHHNPVPYSIPLTGTQGPDVPALELRGSCLTRLANGDLQTTVSLGSLDAAGAITPPALPNATYLVRWVYRDKVYFAAAEDNATQWRYFAGQAAPVSDGAAIKYAYYPAGTSVTGAVDEAAKTLTITVPAALVGAPPVGARLSTVTAYALTHAAPTLPLPPTAANFTDLPQVADVLPAYTAVLAKAAPVRKPTAAGPGGGAGSGGAGAGSSDSGGSGAAGDPGGTASGPAGATAVTAGTPDVGASPVSEVSPVRGPLAYTGLDPLLPGLAAGFALAGMVTAGLARRATRRREA